MSTKLVLLARWACTLTSAAFAQAENSKSKLSKNEKIWVAAYDDTTKALAALFLRKRNQDRKEQNAAYYVLGASVALIGAGLILASRDMDAAQGGSTEQDMNMSFVPILLGFSGILWSGLTLGGMPYPYIRTRLKNITAYWCCTNSSTSSGE
jgi:hypothetical protein